MTSLDPVRPRRVIPGGPRARPKNHHVETPQTTGKPTTLEHLRPAGEHHNNTRRTVAVDQLQGVKPARLKGGNERVALD